MPQPLTPADVALAAYLQSIELCAASMYTSLPEVAQTSISAFATHHTSYATALGTVAGGSAVHVPNQTLTALLTTRLQAATDDTTRATFLFGFENQLAATYGFATTTAADADFLHLLSTIVPICAARSAFLGTLAKLPTALLFPNGPVESSIVGDGTDVRFGFDPTLFPVS